MQLTITQTCKIAYPGACIGVLTMLDVASPDRSPALEEHKAALEQSLRRQFEGQDRSAIKALPVIRAYDAYYKQFKKTYHVQHQLESVALKGHPIASTAPLVEAMFVAELEHLMLTAGHDLNLIKPPVSVDVAKGSESYVRINGQSQILKAGDMFIADAEGILSSIIYGPDRRTMIQPGTRNVLFTVYAPAGIGYPAMEQHLLTLRNCVLLISPQAEVDTLQVYG